MCRAQHDQFPFCLILCPQHSGCVLRGFVANASVHENARICREHNVDKLFYLFIPAAAILGALAVKFLDRLRLKDADSRAREIISQGEKDILNRRKEAELELKEASIHQRSNIETELSNLREEQRERERNLEKRQDSIEKKMEETIVSH